jgi:hypothetical protein
MGGIGARSGSGSGTPERKRREPGRQQHQSEQRRDPIQIGQRRVAARESPIQHDTRDAFLTREARVAESYLVRHFLQMRLPQCGQVFGTPHFRVLNDVARLHDFVCAPVADAIAILVRFGNGARDIAPTR